MIHDSQIWRAHVPLHARDNYVGNTTGYNTNTAVLYINIGLVIMQNKNMLLFKLNNYYHH